MFGNKPNNSSAFNMQRPSDNILDDLELQNNWGKQEIPTEINILKKAGNRVLEIDDLRNHLGEGNARQMLTNVTKGISDPALAKKAQEFFFEKIGIALVNNFKNNRIECDYCHRLFHKDAAKKHIPI